MELRTTELSEFCSDSTPGSGSGGPERDGKAEVGELRVLLVVVLARQVLAVDDVPDPVRVQDLALLRGGVVADVHLLGRVLSCCTQQ